MGSINGRLRRLEGHIQPPEGPEESKWRATRKEYGERLDEMAGIYWRESETIKNRMATLQEQGHSEQDARTIAKDEVLRAKNPQLAEFLNSSYPPEIRRDPVAKRAWLESYIRDRTGRPTLA